MHEAEIKNRLTRLFTQLTKNRGIFSATAAIESMDGSFRWRCARGQSDLAGTPMQADTIFNIASVTKLFIAAAILHLQEDGQLEIDRPIADYLPADLIQGIHRCKDGLDRTHEVTIRHLLSHTSGIPDYFEDSPKGEPRLADRLVTEEDQFWTIEMITEYVREKLTAHFPPLPFDSGNTRVRYSDTNYQLLIAIIHAITGQRHHEAFDDMFFKPLGLHRTFLPGTQPSQPQPSLIWAGEDPLALPLLLSSLGDLNSTLDDLLAFMRALITGSAFRYPETADLMRQDWHTFGLPTTMVPLSPNWPIQYGLGMMRFQLPRIFTPFKPMPAVIGHTGVTGSWLFYCPELELLLAGTLNQIAAAASPYRFVPKILQAMHAA